MLKIAVCDNSKSVLNFYNNIINEYFMANECYGEISTFCSSISLLEAVQNQFFNIFILDTTISDINGIEVGKKFVLLINILKLYI